MSRLSSIIEKRRGDAELETLCLRRKQDIAAMLDHIGDVVQNFGEGEKLNWCHAGSLGRLWVLMTEATAFITGLETDEVKATLEDIHADQ